jgi:toxin ParE1/3/4
VKSELKYHPEAVIELTEAVRWYLEQSSDVAITFFEELQAVEKKVLQSPDRYGAYLHGTRLCRFKRFPFGLVYQQRQDYILIVGVAHLKRKPGYWKSRLPRHH